ncbi:hypothetical protein F4777DRAFT_236646 [Nemania sp. FL0916]|nr:hypothetical protein F4777DRAFT_236646 [Nemania sp. FL0916]
MGDSLPSTNPGVDHDTQETPGSRRQGISPEEASLTNMESTSPSNAAAFQGQYQQIYAPPQNHYPGQLETQFNQGSNRHGVYDMSAMANTLPQAGYRSGYSGGQQHQRYTPAGPNMIPQMVPFPNQPHMSQLPSPQYYVHQHQQIPQFYNPPTSPTTQQHQQHQIGQVRGGMGMGYYPNQVLMSQSQPSVPYYYPSNQFSTQNNLGMNHHTAHPQYVMHDGTSGGPGDSSGVQNNQRARGSGWLVPNEEATGNRPSGVRGPPRKPRQSGHAIWIGNLPPQTELMSLVHHVCREASGLESLFLIAKSNCAFANFKDEESCSMAQQKLHDSKFQSVRLVSRLRKSTVEGSSGQTAPTGPAAILPSAQPTSSDRTPSNPPSKSVNSSSIPEDRISTRSTQNADGVQQKDRFFILKSLTVEDLELSIQNGVWATQAHNEEALNDAFGGADNVYLIFSANKSGEYFGYAQMISPINHDPAAAIEFAPMAQVTNNMDLPRAIPTEATETCPRGRIIDDSARGTIFWEAERDEVDGASDTISDDSESARSAHEGETGTRAWGKPFKLKWLSTTRLPFYRTRGLRNPWNANREVKIARDGTELEPTAGRKLIGLFNRAQSPAPMSTMGVTGFPPQPPPPHFH